MLYLTGDATQPTGDGIKIICHVCNDVGGWGAGFSGALSRRWKEPENVFRLTRPDLGDVQLIQVEQDIIVANMVAQEGIRHHKNAPPAIRLTCLEECLGKVRVIANSISKKTQKDVSFHMPMIGTGHAGGDWRQIRPIILRVLHTETIYVYQFENKESN